MMKRIFCFILPALICVLTSCKEDSEWDNLGHNPVEGTWIRNGAYPKVLALFNADHTSAIQTFNNDDVLVNDLSQGLYRVVGDSLLVYERGFVSHFAFEEDGTLTITYGYNTKKTTVRKYTRVEASVQPETQK